MCADMAGRKGTRKYTRAVNIRSISFPKSKSRLSLADELVDSAVGAILKTASTGKIGDGKIFLYKVEEVIRIRNQERGAVAL